MKERASTQGVLHGLGLSEGPDGAEVPGISTAPPRARTPLGLRLLRMLVHGRLARQLWEGGDWPERNIADALGLRRPHPRQAKTPKGDIEAIEEQLGAWLLQLEQGELEPDPRERNVTWLAERLNLSPVEREVLLFMAMLVQEEALQAAVQAAAPRPHARLALMACGMARPTRAVQDALRPSGVLLRMRLLGPAELHWRASIPVALMSGLDEILAGEYASADALLGCFFRKGPEPERTLEDFPHLGADAALAVRLLRAASKKRAAGVNVLLHGPPGTGKTELARALARAASATLHEVVVEDRDGDAVHGHHRLGAYAVCQRLLGGARDAAVLFDEAEDAFPRLQTGYGLRREAGGSKGWVNALLEGNPTPTLWISNSVDHIDAAYLRRFDLAIEVREPPAPVRRKILEAAVGPLGVSRAWVERHAADPRIRPGHVARAARVAKLVAVKGADDAEHTVARVIDASLRVEGAPAPRRPARLDACAYDPSFVNTSADLGRIIDGLARTRRGTLCLYGPPGTGKSAFVAHLADRVGVPLNVTRGSDLLSMWVGGTEANIAAAFRRATDEGALLFIDEADSFLQDRTRAVRSWEISGVNELLMQMESFEGLFACATNLFESLDAAALRRFAFKVRFDPMRPEQRWRLLVATLAARGVVLGDERARPALDQLSKITPGDFAAVARRVDVLGGDVTAEAFVAELAEEERVKPGAGGGRVGFR
ncbi:MAG: AAA family ATPase [Myxococcales bacterium]|nr:AAA family ATPase [Myxococcales bacterium]